MKVKKETGTRCFRLGRKLNCFSQISLVKNGGIRIIIRKLSIADAKDAKIISPRSPRAIRSIIRIAIIAPDIAPDPRICFQFTCPPSA
tara:strand:+ start:3671 stop:3934 length:264 start_codon:yes stop_codon:yes gene_type:complete